MIVDFHTHILPGMDDGSKSTDESIAMLSEAAAQGVTHVVASSHFYPNNEDPESFLARRDASIRGLIEALAFKNIEIKVRGCGAGSGATGDLNLASTLEGNLDSDVANGDESASDAAGESALKAAGLRSEGAGLSDASASNAAGESALKAAGLRSEGTGLSDESASTSTAAVPLELPEIIPAAEILYYVGISKSDEIDKLRIAGTEYLIIEMPFYQWESNMINEILRLNSRPGFRVILAHVNRYLSYTDMEVLEYLKRNDVLFQFNGEFFRDGFFGRKAYKMVKAGMVDLLGSDCHNTTDRGQNLARTRELIKKHTDEFYLNKIDSVSNWILYEK